MYNIKCAFGNNIIDSLPKIEVWHLPITIHSGIYIIVKTVKNDFKAKRKPVAVLMNIEYYTIHYSIMPSRGHSMMK